MAVSFNGITKRITITGLADYSTVDVEKDLYSAWKNWVIDGANAKYPQAFRPIGGDPIGGTQTVPPYFFLLNDWKVDFSAMSNIGFDTNLYCEESSNATTNPFIISGNGSAISKTSDAPVNTIQISSISQEMEYDGVVYIDTVDGSAGSIYPNGTRAEPVSNLTDALTIANGYNITDFYTVSDLTLDQNVSGKNFIGAGSAIIDLNNQPANGCSFRTAEITGRQNSNFCVYINSRLNGLTNFAGTMTGCFFQSLTPMTIQSFIPCVISDCRSAIAGNNSPIFDFSAGNIDCSVRAYSGGLRIVNSTSAANVSTIEYIAGKFNFGADNTAGYFAVRGVIDTTGIDVTAGATVVYTGSVTTNRELEYNETIHLETDSPTTGSVYPFGLPGNPVNNLADALLLCEEYSLSAIDFHGTMTITTGQDVSGKTIKAGRSLGNEIIVASGAVTDGTYFENVTINGVMGGAVRYTNCVMGDISNFDGGAKNSLITGDITITGSGANYLTECDTYSTDTTHKDISVGGNLLNIIRGRGQFQISDFTGSSAITIDLVSGRLLVNSTCVSGIIAVSGMVSLTDNSAAGCIIIDSTLTKSGITDEVWNASSSDYSESGSIGANLTNLSAESLLMLKSLINKREVKKIGTVWTLLVYDTNDSDILLSKELKDINDNDITDLAAGSLAIESKNSV